MSKSFFRTVAAVAAIAVNVIPGIGQLASFAITAALTVGTSVLLKPKQPKAPKLSPSATDRLYATLDPMAPRKAVFGNTAAATDVRYQTFTGDPQEYYHQIMCVASHEVSSIDEIWFDSELAWSLAGGVQSKYSGYLTVSVKLVGTSLNTVAIDSIWGTNQRLTGCAYVYMSYKLTGNSSKIESPFVSAIPSRVTVRVKGAKVCDPRNGAHSAADQTTWTYTTDTGRNPALQLLWYLLGWKINGKLAVGKGIPPARIDMTSFATAANFCDESVTLAIGGTEPRYRSDGIISEADDPNGVMTTLLATMNGVLRDSGGKIRLDILHNDLGTPVADFTEADVLGEELWKQTVSIDQTPNMVRGCYVDSSNTGLYQLVSYPEVSLASPDNIQRVDSFDLAFVQSVSQSQRLAKQRLQRKQYQGVYTGTFNARALQVSIGDVVTLTHSALGWGEKLFRVMGQGIQLDGRLAMTLQEEHADIYQWDNDESPGVNPTAPTIYNPQDAPWLSPAQIGSAWTPVYNNYITQVGSTFTKTSGVDQASDSYLYSVESFLQASISTKASALATIVIGLDSTGGTGVAVWQTIDYGVILGNDGNVWRTASGTAAILTTYTASDVIGIEHRDTTIVLLKNNTIIHTFTGISATAYYHLAASFLGLNKNLNSLSFTAKGKKGDTGPQGPQGPTGPTGGTGSAGRDAVVFYQDATPTGQVVGDTWISTSGKVFRRWNGSSWVQLLGDVAALALITEAYIGALAVGTAKMQDLSVTTLKVDNLAIGSVVVFSSAPFAIMSAGAYQYIGSPAAGVQVTTGIGTQAPNQAVMVTCALLMVRSGSDNDFATIRCYRNDGVEIGATWSVEVTNDQFPYFFAFTDASPPSNSSPIYYIQLNNTVGTPQVNQTYVTGQLVKK
jgi:hypothetical protein